MRVRSVNDVSTSPSPRVVSKATYRKVHFNKPNERDDAEFDACPTQLKISLPYKPLKRSSGNVFDIRHPALNKASEHYQKMFNPLIKQLLYFASEAHYKGRENVGTPKRSAEPDVRYKGDTLRSYECHKCSLSETVVNFRREPSDCVSDEQSFESSPLDCLASDRRLLVDGADSTKLVARPETTVPLSYHKLPDVNATSFLRSSSDFNLEDVRFTSKHFPARFGMPLISAIRKRRRRVRIFRLPRGTPTQLTTNILFQHSLHHKTCITAGQSVIPDLKVHGLLCYRRESYSSEYRIVINCTSLSYIGYLVKFAPLSRSIPANVFHAGQHFCYTVYAVDLQTEQRLDMLVNFPASLQPTTSYIDSEPWNLVSGMQISATLSSHCYFLRKHLRQLVWNHLSLDYGQVIAVGMVSRFGLLKYVPRRVIRLKQPGCHVAVLLPSSLPVMDFMNLTHAVGLKCGEQSEPQMYSVIVTPLVYFVASDVLDFTFDYVEHVVVDDLSEVNNFIAEELPCRYTSARNVPPTLMQNVKSREKLKQNDKPCVCTHYRFVDVYSVLTEMAIESKSSLIQHMLIGSQVVPYYLPCAVTQPFGEGYSYHMLQPTLCSLSVYSEVTRDRLEAFDRTKHALSIMHSNMEFISLVVNFQDRIEQKISCQQTYTNAKLAEEEKFSESPPDFFLHTTVQRLPATETDHLYDITHASSDHDEVTSLVFSGSNLWTCWLQQCTAASLSGFMVKTGFYGLCSDDILPVTGACLALGLCALICFRKTR
ncbi:hypothetical protein EG68_02674 [Paragonimus skrjabini miyazakii]|uniref:Uncharacterized protein n=1 Tax=Paragonimus skrjabini miyazakii TaxID=59628 RepID=A0A8S9Z4P5_9TREM|nr:hypothetical protein EG68_02674 [Paragonimus skrjabini miyazakii]